MPTSVKNPVNLLLTYCVVPMLVVYGDIFTISFGLTLWAYAPPGAVVYINAVITAWEYVINATLTLCIASICPVDDAGISRLHTYIWQSCLALKVIYSCLMLKYKNNTLLTFLTEENNVDVISFNEHIHILARNLVLIQRNIYTYNDWI